MHARGGTSHRETPEQFVARLTAGVFLLSLIALSPHLVHHLFEAHHGLPSCPFLAQAQHTPSLQPEPPALSHPQLAGSLETPELGITPFPREGSHANPRAPPPPPASA
jgi:hypothetical protein